MLGTFRLCGLLIFAVACKTPSADSATAPASGARASGASPAAATPSATRSPFASGVPASSTAPAASASAIAQRSDPLDHQSPVVRESRRDPAVKLCCDMFGPYVTGCVAVAERCYGDIQSYCQEAWKRGAQLSAVEPGIRKLVQKDRYYMPKPCVAPQPPSAR